MALPTQIPGGGDGLGSLVAPVVPAGTPAPSGVAPATPANTPAGDDWRTRFEESQRALEEIRTNAERDVRGVKSSLQQQIAAMERQREDERRALEAQIHSLSTKGLDENERSKYELGVARDRLTQMEKQRETDMAQLQTLQDVPRYISSFLALGVQPDKLVVDQGLEALLESGWREVVATREALVQENTRLKSGSGTIVPAVPAGGVGGSTLIQAPLVASPSGGTPVMGNTWPQVVKAVSDQFGRPVTQEEVYRMIELGQLSPTIIPGLQAPA